MSQSAALCRLSGDLKEAGERAEPTRDLRKAEFLSGVPIQNLNPDVLMMGPPRAVSLRCDRTSASAENPEHLYPMRDESGSHCNTKHKPSGHPVSGPRSDRSPWMMLSKCSQTLVRAHRLREHRVTGVKPYNGAELDLNPRSGQPRLTIVCQGGSSSLRHG